MDSAEPTPWYEAGVEHEFDYALMPFVPGDPTYRPAREAARFNRPPVIEEVPLPAEGLPAGAAPWIELEGDAELTCMRRIRKGVYQARLWETAGRTGWVRLKWHGAIKEARKTTAAGEDPVPLAVRGNEIKLRLHRFEIATLLLIMERDR